LLSNLPAVISTTQFFKNTNIERVRKRKTKMKKGRKKETNKETKKKKKRDCVIFVEAKQLNSDSLFLC
jgi:hypothetical protein